MKKIIYMLHQTMIRYKIINS